MKELNIDYKKYIGIHSPGYVIRIFKDGKFYEYLIGNREVIPEVREVTHDTYYDIASLTKIFTSTLVYKAYEDGKLDIEDYIFDIDNKFKNLTDIKVIDLLSHRVELWTDGYLGNSKSKKEFLDKVYNVTVKKYEPVYIDVHYMVLSRMLEDIYNKDYYDLLKEYILNPLGLNSITYDPKGNIASSNYEHQTEKIVDNIYPGFIHDTKARVAHEFGLHTGHAGLFSTAEDLLNFLLSFMVEDKKILSEDTIRLMLKRRDVNKENFENLYKVYHLEDVNKMYKLNKQNDNYVNIARCINGMGARFKSTINKTNDVPSSASDSTIVFSGYSGPCFLIDFDKRIAFVVMSNVVHNSYLNRIERKATTDILVEEIYNEIIKE